MEFKLHVVHFFNQRARNRKAAVINCISEFFAAFVICRSKTVAAVFKPEIHYKGILPVVILRVTAFVYSFSVFTIHFLCLIITFFRLHPVHPSFP